jgi:hypothetical protein
MFIIGIALRFAKAGIKQINDADDQPANQQKV